MHFLKQKRVKDAFWLVCLATLNSGERPSERLVRNTKGFLLRFIKLKEVYTDYSNIVLTIKEHLTRHYVTVYF